MQNWNGNSKGYGNRTSQVISNQAIKTQSRPVQNLATGGMTQVMQPTTQKKRVKVAAGWNGQYGPQVSLDISALHAISRLLLEQGIESGSLRLRFYANSNKTNPRAPDFTFVASEVFGIYMTGQGYHALEIRPQGQTHAAGNAQEQDAIGSDDAPF